MRSLLLGLTAIASMCFTTAEAQNTKYFDVSNLMKHLDLNVTAGTTGVGFELSTPINDMVKLRSGFSIMPGVELPTSFNIQVGDDASQSQSKFDNLSKKLSDVVGKPIDSNADVDRKLKFWNWNVLVDVYPFKQNKHWHFTGGFFLGPSKIAEAYNTTECMPTLMAVNIYNAMYDKLHGLTPEEMMDVQLIDLGPGFEGYTNDVGMNLELQERLDRYGRMGINMGYYSRNIVDEDGNIVHQKGDPYLMEPNSDCMVKVTMRANSFKPYLGFGYGGRLLKNDDRYHVSFDCGFMLWGGTPHLETHDGTDLTHDVEDVPGSVGSNVRMIEKFKVFPVLNFVFTRKLF